MLNKGAQKAIAIIALFICCFAFVVMTFHIGKAKNMHYQKALIAAHNFDIIGYTTHTSDFGYIAEGMNMGTDYHAHGVSYVCQCADCGLMATIDADIWVDND